MKTRKEEHGRGRKWGIRGGKGDRREEGFGKGKGEIGSFQTKEWISEGMK